MASGFWRETQQDNNEWRYYREKAVCDGKIYVRDAEIARFVHKFGVKLRSFVAFADLVECGSQHIY